MGIAMGTDTALHSAFDTDLRRAGWVYLCPPEDDAEPTPTGEWVPPSDAGCTGCLSAGTGYWESPAFPVEPMRYYAAEFLIRADGPGYFWVNYRNDRDLPVSADNCTEFDASSRPVLRRECFRAPLSAAKATIRFHALGGNRLALESVRVRNVSSGEVAGWIASLGESIGRVEYAPPPDRLAAVPQTARKLHEGGRIRIVMLGDSIMNDSANSLYETRLEPLCPGVRIEVVASVNGGTGCWFYKKAVDEWVLRHEPDLVMIGGISQRNDVDSIREVVEDIRAACDAEVVLLTGPAGVEGDPAGNPDWNEHVSLASDGYHARIKRLADELHCEFVDLATAWGLHMKSCGKPYEHFMRDSLHANTRGKLVIGEILRAHFAPVEQAATARAG